MFCKDCEDIKMIDKGCTGFYKDEQHDVSMPVYLYQCPKCSRVELI
jgi:hypothetical protein